MRTADLEAEWCAAQDSLWPEDALTLDALRFPRGVIKHMIGIAQVRLSGGFYEPDALGKWAYISPARVVSDRLPGAPIEESWTQLRDYSLHHEPNMQSPFTDWDYPHAVLGGELIDLVCWDISNPHVWAQRCGAAEWLGCATRWDPTPIRRSPVAWLRHRCNGLVMLTSDRIRQYEILSNCNDIVAEDNYHADQLSSALQYPYPRKAVFLAA